MTPAQKDQLITVLHLHKMVHGQDMSDMIDEVKQLHVTMANEEHLRGYIGRTRANRTKSDIYEAALKAYETTTGVPIYEPEDVVSTVLSVVGLPMYMVQSKLRERHVVDARHLIAGLLHRHCPTVSLERIGEYIGRHYSSAIHSNKMFHALCSTDIGFADKRRKVEAILNGSR
jgi:chromosomal replication initiation ATPase DnaA